jgi:hypothetical protein
LARSADSGFCAKAERPAARTVKVKNGVVFMGCLMGREKMGRGAKRSRKPDSTLRVESLSLRAKARKGAGGVCAFSRVFAPDI